MTDEVDKIVAAWHNERPDLDVSPMAVLSRVSRLAAMLADRRAAVFARHQLLAYEFDVLAALRRAGEPYELSAGQLVAATHVTSGTMTNRIDKLAEKKWVRRRPDVADGRVVRIRLAAAGRRKVDGALADLLEVERTMLAPLSDAGRRRLAQQLCVLTSGLESG